MEHAPRLVIKGLWQYDLWWCQFDPAVEMAVPETDSMVCRACGNEERASEGYPCAECGTFICLICSFRGVTLCKGCTEKKGGDTAPPSAPTPP